MSFTQAKQSATHTLYILVPSVFLCAYVGHFPQMDKHLPCHNPSHSAQPFHEGSRVILSSDVALMEGRAERSGPSLAFRMSKN